MKTVSDREIEQFYQVLELPLNSSSSEVKAAYRSLARQYHPDRFTGDPEKLKTSEEHCKRINVAYDFLKTYDPPAQKASPSATSVRVKYQTNPTPTNRTPAAFVQEARRLQALGNLEEAIMALDTAIALEDDYYPAYELRSQLRLMRGNSYSAKSDLRRAKHFKWVYESEGRSIDNAAKSKASPTKPSPSTTKASTTKASQPPSEPKKSTQTKQSKPSTTHSSNPPQSQKPPQHTNPQSVKTTPSPPAPPPEKSSENPAAQPKLLQTFQGHLDSISQLLFVNRSLISASHDGSVQIWSTETGELQDTLMVGAAVTAIAASPDANLFITGDRSGKIKMWHLASRRLIRSIPLHTGKVTGIHFTQNGEGFVTTGDDGILKIFQLNPASLRHTLQISKVPIFCSGLMGNRIFTASANSQLTVIEQGQIVHAESLASPMSQTMAVNVDRKSIAIGDDRGSVHCFDLQGNLQKSFVGCHGRIRAINVLASGKKLLVAGETPLIKIWDTTTWDLSREWEVPGKEQISTATICGNKIAIAQGNSVYLWQLP